MVDDPELPDLATVAAWIRDTRYELEITLEELGEEARLSTTQLNRLEKAEGNPSYEAVYRVYETLQHRLDETSVRSVLEAKRDRYEDEETLQFEYVAPRASCTAAAERMATYDISQLPVIADTDAVGSITEADLMDVSDPQSTTVEEEMGPPFPEVPLTARQKTVRNLLRRHRAVLLTQDADGRGQPVVGEYVGLLTAADFRPVQS